MGPICLGLLVPQVHYLNKWYSPLAMIYIIKLLCNHWAPKFISQTNLNSYVKLETNSFIKKKSDIMIWTLWILSFYDNEVESRISASNALVFPLPQHNVGFLAIVSLYYKQIFIWFWINILCFWRCRWRWQKVITPKSGYFASCHPSKTSQEGVMRQSGLKLLSLIKLIGKVAF